MTLSADDMQTAFLHHLVMLFLPFFRVSVIRLAAQDDIYTAAGHIGGHRNSSQSARLGYDIGFFFMQFGVQNLMLDTFPQHHIAEHLGFFDGHRTNEYRPPFIMQFFHCLDDLIELSLFILVNFIDQVLPYHRFVGGDSHDFQLINFVEFLGLGQRGPGHAGQFPVHTEIILESHGGIGPRLFFNLNACPFRHFFRFNRLMQTI